ncbi:hypothetical protein V6N13_062073 [Hibiscus sabdariffa]
MFIYLFRVRILKTRVFGSNTWDVQLQKFSSYIPSTTTPPVKPASLGWTWHWTRGESRVKKKIVCTVVFTSHNHTPAPLFLSTCRRLVVLVVGNNIHGSHHVTSVLC